MSQDPPAWPDRDADCNADNICYALNCAFKEYSQNVRPHVKCKHLYELEALPEEEEKYFDASLKYIPGNNFTSGL